MIDKKSLVDILTEYHQLYESVQFKMREAALCGYLPERDLYSALSETLEEDMNTLTELING